MFCIVTSISRADFFVSGAKCSIKNNYSCQLFNLIQAVLV